ncbi:hypothetical protein ACFL3V_06360, partial [Nanoarchaeota archaeon]
VPEITFRPDTIKGGRELEIEAKVTNNGEDTISDISINMASDIIGNKGWRHIELGPGKKHYAYNKILNAPTDDEEKEYFIKISGNYQTASGKIMEFDEMKTITVTPQDKLAELTPTIKVDGKEVNVTLKIKNIAPHKLTYVSLIDTFPSGFKSTAGSRDIDIEELAIGEELTAYSYIVKVPDTFTGDEFKITHVFNGLDKDEEKIMTETKTTVKLEDAGKAGTGTDEEDSETNETADKTEEEEGEETTEKQDKESKPGVFTRMWRWVKGLFSKEPEDTME